MLVPGTLGEQQKDFEMSAHHWLRLGQPVGVLEQLGQVVEADRDVGVIGSVARLIDGQRAAGADLGGPELWVRARGEGDP